ncbi:type III-B CRISPR module RAMP protein Cmr4 [Anoxybacter fermentans]|uniref:Type III-B CRISPR module RAMP protein Cmr4 n=1 Tax=Anoxybacter fermentans TaxID=1323375 RepID=A0A3S9SUS6_9FIRM|nr:type III-B CRISPR module RAMP protein Cmr4 [Anoxybacter fermentans]AZR72032.1 type III-B CRISPR module RAMP protein Cmr4 [Anoxybacter fermentans]
MIKDMCEKKIGLLTAIDPIHIGTGGYRMDRVDNSIIRDVDGIPKIPGTSLSGAVRSYAALHYNDNKCGGANNCGAENCEICQTFGVTGDKASLKGLVSFYDALILLFPVATVAGPIWITTPNRIKNFLKEFPDSDKKKNYLDKLPEINDNECYLMSTNTGELKDISEINLGWLLINVKKLEKTDEGKGNQEAKEESDKIEKLKQLAKDIEEKIILNVDNFIRKRIALVNDKIFNLIVNDNLEVRTSVAIDPVTGAAVDGALFTYEAIPRLTVFYSITIIAKPEYFQNSIEYSKAKEIVEKGFEYLEYMGIGGMTTRGFGRMRYLDIWAKEGQGGQP